MAQDASSSDRKVLTPNDLQHVVCPVCHAALCLEGVDSILCTGCGLRYPIVDGLPILLVERAL